MAIEGSFLNPQIIADASEDLIVVKTTQDIEPYLEANKRRLNDNPSGTKKGSDLKLVGSIPLVIVHKWLVEEGLDIFNPDHEKAIMRKLNDPDYRYLRTSTGLVGI